MTVDHADVPRVMKKGKRGSLIHPLSPTGNQGRNFKEPPSPVGTMQHFLQRRNHFSSRVGTPSPPLYPYSFSESSLDPRCNASFEDRNKDHTRGLCKRAMVLSQRGWLTPVILAAKTECSLIKSSVHSKLQARASYRMGPSLKKETTKTREKESRSLESNPNCHLPATSQSLYLSGPQFPQL